MYVNLKYIIVVLHTIDIFLILFHVKKKKKNYIRLIYDLQ